MDSEWPRVIERQYDDLSRIYSADHHCDEHNRYHNRNFGCQHDHNHDSIDFADRGADHYHYLATVGNVGNCLWPGICQRSGRTRAFHVVDNLRQSSRRLKFYNIEHKYFRRDTGHAYGLGDR